LAYAKKKDITNQDTNDVLQECLPCFPKLEQTEALELCLMGHEVVAILPTGFGKNLIYQVFCLAKLSVLNPNANVLVIWPLNIEEQVSELTDRAGSERE